MQSVSAGLLDGGFGECFHSSYSYLCHVYVHHSVNEKQKENLSLNFLLDLVVITGKLCYDTPEVVLKINVFFVTTLNDL